MRISEDELREHFEEIIQRISLDRESMVLMCDGVPTLKLVPYEDDPPSAAFGCMSGTIEISGDLLQGVKTS